MRRTERWGVSFLTDTTQHVEAPVAQFIESCNAIIQHTLGVNLYGNTNLTEEVALHDSVYTTVLYRIGNGTRSIEYRSLGDRVPSAIIRESGASAVVSLPSSPESAASAILRILSESPEQEVFSKAILVMLSKMRGEAAQSSVYTWLADPKVQNDPTLRNLFTMENATALYNNYLNWTKRKRREAKSYQKFMEYLRDVLPFEVKRGKRPPTFATPKTITPATEPKKELTQQEKYQQRLLDYALKPEEKFEQIHEYTEDVAKGKANSFILAGDPGTGKSYSVIETLNILGFMRKMVTAGNTENAVEPLGPSEYVLYGGRITSFGFYTLLYRYNGGLLVFDDCDSIFEEVDQDMLKNVLDDKKERVLANENARTSGKTAAVPPQFMFTGRVIFITNKYKREIDSAVMSRSLFVELDMTTDEIVERISSVMDHLLPDVPEATTEVKQEVLEFLVSIRDLYKKLDFRTFEQSVKERLRGSPNWKHIVAALVVSKSAA